MIFLAESLNVKSEALTADAGGHTIHHEMVLWRGQEGLYCNDSSICLIFGALLKIVIKRCCAQINIFCGSYFPVSRKLTLFLLIFTHAGSKVVCRLWIPRRQHHLLRSPVLSGEPDASDNRASSSSPLVQLCAPRFTAHPLSVSLKWPEDGPGHWSIFFGDEEGESERRASGKEREPARKN